MDNITAIYSGKIDELIYIPKTKKLITRIIGLEDYKEQIYFGK